MVRAGDNLSILSAEAPINQPLMTDGSAFVQLEDEFRQAFEMTVIDLPRNMLINFPQLLADVNLVVLTCELTLASARDTIRILSWLKTNAGHAHPMIVANKVQPAVAEISKADFEASIERKIDFVVPYDIKAASNAAKLGQVFVDANRSSKATAAIRQIAERVAGVNGEDLSSFGEERKSLLGGFDLKSLLAKKAKSEPAEA
jgi:pilus assembly protein CpaE